MFIERFSKTLANAILAVTLTSATALAGERLVVVELFTSQGCSSCPPADELLGELAEYDDIIPLALHVDYWDYIGWKDTFAKATHTQRQKAYAHTAGARMIYTPQMIVGGVDLIVGNRAAEIGDALDAHRAAPQPVTVSLARQDAATITIDLAVVGAVEGDMVVQLVRYSPTEQVTIKRGENAGKTITYHNIVRDWQILGSWDGSATTMTAPAEGDAPVVAIVQAGDHGAIVGAARLR